jgi:hypothetical protein
MSIGDWEQAARIVAIGAGIIFGALAISSVSWVWFKQQIFAYGGSVLSVTGIVLIGLSIYKTVDVTAAPSGIGIKLAEMENLLKEQGESQKAAQAKLSQFPMDIEAKIAALDKVVKEQGAAQTARFEKLQNDGTPLKFRTMPVYGQATEPSTGNYTVSKANQAFDLTKAGDGTMKFYFPDLSSPAYVESLKKQIADVKSKGSSGTDLTGLYMKLGEAYQSTGQKNEALQAYQQGIEALKEAK